MKSLAALLLASFTLAAHSQDAAPRPRVVALIAAVGDRIEVVRQIRQTGSHLEPFSRNVLQVSNQALNYAVLRGLDAAEAADEPQTQRVLLQWTMPAEPASRIESALGKDREQLVMDTVKHYLRALPDRQDWDRIEMIVPTYKLAPVDGMGMRLSGIGIYIQPIGSEWVRFGTGGDHEVRTTNLDGSFQTTDPSTGKAGNSSIYVAPYMYFERLTFDAKSLELIKRQSFYANKKFADPQTISYDAGSQMSAAQVEDALVNTVEQAAYQSIRPDATLKQAAYQPAQPAARDTTAPAPIKAAMPASGG